MRAPWAARERGDRGGHLRQLFPLSFADNHSDTAINQLRMAIEIRLLRGFGVAARVTLAGAVVPLALSEILEAIAPRKSDITFGVPFEHIERLYRWSNIYMHSGFKQYTWSQIYGLHYLRPFLLGSGTNTYDGIITRSGIVKQVQCSRRSKDGSTSGIMTLL